MLLGGTGTEESAPTGQSSSLLLPVWACARACVCQRTQPNSAALGLFFFWLDPTTSGSKRGATPGVPS